MGSAEGLDTNRYKKHKKHTVNRRMQVLRTVNEHEYTHAHKNTHSDSSANFQISQCTAILMIT